MDERYFLYFEELDLCIKTRKAGWKIGFEPNNKIYHKEGAVINANRKKKHRSFLADFYSIRNRLLITFNFYPICIPFIYLSLIGVILNRIRRKQFDRIIFILKLMIRPHLKHDEI